MSSANPVVPHPSRPDPVDMPSPDLHQWTYDLNVHSLPPALDMSLRLDGGGGCRLGEVVSGF